MPNILTRSLLKATGLTQAGRLMDATRLIQRALGGSVLPASQPQTAPVIILPGPPTQPTQRAQPTPIQQPAANDDQAGKPHPNFSEQSFRFENQTYPYRLFVPKAPEGEAWSADLAPMPLVVLLHGCKQDALDFSKGTAMNALAGDEQCLVLYPEQISRGNAQMCWNWFEPDHQQVGTGEPGMIAALTRQVLASDYNGRRADPRRVYIAGLSAGGAMAAVVARLYPDLFAALGVHSGLAAGAAKSLVSAFSAMRSGAKGHKTQALPTIVFHGTADTTVNQENGELVAQAAITAFEAAGQSLVQSRTSSDMNGLNAERTVHSNGAGTPLVENWRIAFGPHAWSGGSSQGSYTDANGPDASAAMLAFFLRHKQGD